MNRKLSFQTIVQISSFLLGIIFLLAAFSKIGDLEAFHNSLSDMNFLPFWVKGLSVLIVPGLELALGFCLLIRFAPKEISSLASLLLIVFLCLSIYSNIVGHPSSCGCFKLKAPSWFQLTGWWIVARNLFFLTLAGLIFRAEIQKNCIVNSTFK